MNFKELLEGYKTKETRVVLREIGSFGRVWIGDVIGIEDDFIEFKGINPHEIFEARPFGIGRLNEKDMQEWGQKVWDKASSLKIPFSSIASLQEVKDL